MPISTPEEAPREDEAEASNKKTSQVVVKAKQLAMQLAEELKAIDPNYDRSSKFSRQLESSFSSYDQFLKVKNLNQKKVTSYFKPKEKETLTVAVPVVDDDVNLNPEDSAEMITDDDSVNDDEEMEVSAPFAENDLNEDQHVSEEALNESSESDDGDLQQEDSVMNEELSSEGEDNNSEMAELYGFVSP